MSSRFSNWASWPDSSPAAFNIRRRGPDGGVVLDPSGVVKGWAVDRAARALDELPATDFCLSAGGDLVCRTKMTAAPAWRIGIEDPRDVGRIIAVAPVRNGAVATSGLAHRGAHIVDARTGQTPRELASVTMIGASLAWAASTRQPRSRSALAQCSGSTAATAATAGADSWCGPTGHRNSSAPGRQGLIATGLDLRAHGCLLAEPRCSDAWTCS